MEINILDYRLRLISINKASGCIARFTHALLDILFLRSKRLRREYGYVQFSADMMVDNILICDAL